MIQQLRENITAALAQSYPKVPVYIDGTKPLTPYFSLELLTATYDRQRENRYMAVYRMGIRYEQGGVLDSEEMADGLCEALAAREAGHPAFRVIRQAWETGQDGKGPLFTVDYMLYVQQQGQGQPNAELMGRLTEGERLK